MADLPRTGPGQREGPDVPPRPPIEKATILLVGIIRLLSTVVDKYGWPGFVLVVGLLCIHLWAADAQKEQIVGKFVLGEGMAAWWPIAVSAAFCALVVWAQYETNKKTVRLLKREIARIGAEKSALQQLISGRSLEQGSGDDEEDF